MRPSYRVVWHLADGSRLETDGYAPLNLLGHAEIFELRLAQACGGQAECGTCRVTVLDGTLTPPTGEELELQRTHRKAFAPRERLACQARPRSDLEVALPGRQPADLRGDP